MYTSIEANRTELQMCTNNWQNELDEGKKTENQANRKSVTTQMLHLDNAANDISRNTIWLFHTPKPP